MPRIPEYNEQYRYAGRAGNLGGRLNPGDYGGTAGTIGASGRIAGQQWQQAGAALTKAADTAAVIYDDYNTTKAQQAVSGLQKNFLAWQSEMAKNKGEAGMDAGAQYEQWQKKQVAELTKGMNDIQRGRFNALAEVKAAGFRQWAADYGSEQGLVFRNAEDVAGIKASGEVLVANLTNPSIAEPAIDSIRKNAESIANRKGLGEAARARFIKDALSESITPAIAAQIDAGKLSTARTALLHYKDKIGAANALKLQTAIQREGRRLEAEARAERERAETQRALGIRAFGRQDYEAIRPNLKGLVLEERPPSDAVSKSADWLRERLVPWGLAFNLKTAILQSTAVFPAMNDLGASNTMRGICAVAKGGYALIKEIWGISPYMKSRAANIDQDLRKAMRGIDARTRQKVVKLLGKELTWDDVVEAGMLPLISVDMATSSAIWMAAYNKEMAALMNSPAGKPGIDPSSEHHAAAVRAADMAVKAVNPDFNPSSRSQFLRSRGMARFLNMFSSAVVLFAQRRAYNAAALRQAWGKAPSAGGKMRAALRYARYEMYDFALQGVAMGIILSLAYGEDDPKKWGENMAGAWLDAAAMRVPVFGSPVTALITGETWRGVSMIYDQPWQMAKRTSGALHKGNGDGLALSLADIISFELKVPVSRLGRNAVRGYEQWQKGKGTPLSPLMPRPGR